MRHPLSFDGFDGFDIVAPAILGGDVSGVSEAAVLGSAVWLWMHSKSHRNAPLYLLSTLLMPAIKRGQFVLVSEHGKPVFYLAWASLSDEAEHRYLNNPPQCMREEDWASGDRIWMLDWVAPFGHTARMRMLATRRLFPGWCARSLYHRGDQRGLRLIDWHGIAVTRDEARFWFDKHPPMLDSPRQQSSNFQ